jgi:hypothetical protein
MVQVSEMQVLKTLVITPEFDKFILNFIQIVDILIRISVQKFQSSSLSSK